MHYLRDYIATISIDDLVIPVSLGIIKGIVQWETNRNPSTTQEVKQCAVMLDRGFANYSAVGKIRYHRTESAVRELLEK